MDKANNSFGELIDIALLGDESNLNKHLNAFEKHSNRLIDNGNMACFMSNDLHGNQMVDMVCTQLKILLPSIIDSIK